MMPLKNSNQEKKAPSETRWKAKFAKPLVAYAELYGEDVRTIKRWVAIGKKHDALPPLDSPSEMLGWFQHHHKRPASPRLYDLSGASSQPSTPPPSPINLQEIRGLTPQENVEKLRRNLAIVEARLAEAIRLNDTGAMAIEQRNYKEIAEIWRRAEVSLDEIERGRGASLPRAQVEAEILQSLEMLKLMRQAMPRKIAAEVAAGLTLEAAVEKVRQSEDTVFRNVSLFV